VLLQHEQGATVTQLGCHRRRPASIRIGKSNQGRSRPANQLRIQQLLISQADSQIGAAHTSVLGETDAAVRKELTRVSDINCALGIEQLRTIDVILDRRESIPRQYNKILRCNPNLNLPSMALPHRKISCFVDVVRLSSRFNELHRDWIVSEMRSREIALDRYFAPIHVQPIYQSSANKKAVRAVTEFQAPCSHALPFFNGIREEEIKEVCRTLVELIQSSGAAGSSLGN
jgi:hypothetical protein